MKLLLITALAVLLQQTAVKAEALTDAEVKRCRTAPNGCTQQAATRYQYDRASNTCKKMNPFSGCLTVTDNRYEFLENCEKCIEDKRPDEPFVQTKERCLKAPTNDCIKKVDVRYYYDSQSNTCKTMATGGCIANDNRWEVLTNCQNNCIEQNPAPPQPVVTNAPPATLPPDVIHVKTCDADKNHVFYIIAAMNDKVIEVPEDATVGSEIRMWTRDPVPNRRQLWYYDDDCFIKSFYNDLIFWNHDDGTVENLTLQPLTDDVRGHWKIDQWKVYNANTVNDVITRVLDVRDANQANGATLITYKIKNLSDTDNQHFRTETIPKF